MSLPEISRRCLACGASVRAGARFCPQCGHNLLAEGEAEGSEDARGAQAADVAGALKEEPRPAPATRPGTEPAPREEPPPPRATREVEKRAREASPATRDAFATVRDVNPPAGDAVPPTRETSSFTFAGDAREAPDAVGGAHAHAGELADAGPRVYAETAGTAGRSRRAAARVKETVMPRVEKMRDEALVRIEETPDDSGLRFVVISVVLFGLFLLFLLLSTTVLR
jgi:hypothetical protein